ncbi:MAG: type II toxin-antitoxin system PemK/MazF family toxin [Methanoregula sp.]|nr:type II toxin-antitoxin system PemK/MazF family toxin [Methanoregula sp.]
MSNAKKRPAFVIAPLDGDDVILCQITSRQVKDQYSIPISEEDFIEGSLRQDSNVRPNRLFTADCRIIQYRAGHLNDQVLNAVIDRIIGILKD